MALSTTEAECCALIDCICKAFLTCKLLKELKLQYPGPVEISEGNQSAISIVESDGPSKQLKHIEIKQCVQEDKIEVSYMSTADQTADILTKELPFTTFDKHRSVLGIEV